MVLGEKVVRKEEMGREEKQRDQGRAARREHTAEVRMKRQLRLPAIKQKHT